jgi:hypothetical protein
MERELKREREAAILGFLLNHCVEFFFFVGGKVPWKGCVIFQGGIKGWVYGRLV